MTTKHQDIAMDVVEARDVRLGFSPAELKRHWFGGDPWMTHFFNGLFFAVPDGERWVMESARCQSAKIQDPAMQRVVKEFIRQEAMHSREHDAVNALMGDIGLPSAEIEQRFVALRKKAQSLCGDDMQASIAAAIEHFTAILSEVMLENPALFDDMDEKSRALIYWHMVEETEHKSVSHDLFTRTVGDDTRAWLLRNGGLALTFAFGFGVVIAGQLYLLRKDRQLTNLRSLRHCLSILLVREKVLLKVAAAGVPYLKRDFHPWDRDNRSLIARWKEAYARTGDVVQATNLFHRWQRETDNGRRASPVSRLARRKKQS